MLIFLFRVGSSKPTVRYVGCVRRGCQPRSRL